MELGIEAASEATVAVLVEAAVGTTGVMQLLSGGEGVPYPSPAANAVVLSSSSTQSGDHTYIHTYIRGTHPRSRTGVFCRRMD